ncbi:MAG TPA: hypothetical protein VMW48_18895, partial [Vicinamibacterales bacterium]|nr:hypothetical protein [Vicinamibacterales bacterium]
TRTLTDPASYKADVSGLATSIALAAVQTHGDETWATAVVSGLATSIALAAVQTHGDETWATAAGFSTHGAADVWSVVARTLTDPASYKADVSGLATSIALAAVQTHGDGTWATAVVSGLATATNLAVVDAVVDAALAILKADKVIDTATDPWELVLYTQGAAQTAENEIFRKALSQPDGTAVTSTDDIVGQEEHTT